MRVLQVHNRYREPGGEDRIYETEGDLLAAAGHEVRRYEVINPEGRRAATGALLRAPWNRSRAQAVARLVGEWRPDVAHVYNTWFELSPAVLVALRKHGVPTVALLDNYRTQCVDASFFREGQICTDCLGKVPWRGVAHACYRDSRALSAVVCATSTFHRAIGTWTSLDALVVSSEWMRRVMIKSGVQAELVRVLPHSTTDPGPRADPPSKSGEVICLGRISETKGCIELAREWIANRDRLGGMKLTFIGDGPLAGELDQLQDSGISRIPWLPKEEVASALLRARALICPSTWHEPFGLVAIEAMAAGLPIVVSDRGALPEFAAGGVGAVASIGDRGSWTTALTGLLEDRYVDEAGRRARARFEERFSPSVALRNLLDLYEGLGAAVPFV